jgi:hypothetical protein
MRTADATTRPTVPEEPGSSRRLDEVGTLAVLGAMVEQKKRASRPAPEEIGNMLLAPELDDGDADETHQRRVAQQSDVFVKVR